MRKYILTDRNGVTTTGQSLQPGKFILNQVDQAALLTNLSGCGGDTPLLAVLISPVPAGQARMFHINCWNVAVDPKQPQAYTVIKEIEGLPAVSTEQRLRFALLVAKETCADKDFRRWADLWLAGADRGAAAAQRMRVELEKEKQAEAELETLGAWGEASGDSSEAQHHREGTNRALHVLHAVQLSAEPDKEASMVREVARALAGMERFAPEVNLAALAELAWALDTNGKRVAG